MEKPVALVTGASSGIGEALAEEWARRGYRVVALARREERLRSLAARVAERGGEVLALAADVSVDGELDRAVHVALDRFGRVDVAIANAGISVEGRLDKLSIDDFRRVFETNVMGVLRTAYATLPALTATKGRFGAVGSVSSYLATPGLSAYTASKHAVRGLAASLTAEWSGRGASVTHIAPGFVTSEIRERGGRGDPVPAWLVMPREQAAREIVDAMLARRDEVVITGHGKVAVALARHASGLVAGALRLAARGR